MNKREAERRILKLRDEINRHRYLVHVQNKEEISEAALDSLKHELTQLEQEYPELITPDSPSQRVAGQPLEGFTKVEHQTRMLSLNDIFNFKELQEWENRLLKLAGEKSVKKSGYFAEIKLDGFAISLIYQDGVLVQAATRGDGFVGEDVTANVRTIEAIPLRLFPAPNASSDLKKLAEKASRSRFEARGEVYISKKDFEELNQEQKDKGLPLFANPRNTAAGSMRQLDPKLTAKRRLKFFCFGLVSDDVPYHTHQEEHEIGRTLGLPVEPNSRFCSNRKEVQQFLTHWEEKRKNLPYGTDGVVINTNDEGLFAKLGVVGKAPRGAVAYKFSAEQTTTIIRKIELRIGRTGAVTPTAIFDPVKLAGSTVSRATLHNAAEIARKDLRIGDTVIIQKAGDIIPEVVQVLPNLRPKDSQAFVFPKTLQGATLVRQPGEVAYYVKTKTVDQVKRALEHFASRGAMDIDHLGEKVISKLVDAGLVRTFADIYRLNKEKLLQVEGFADLSVDNLLAAIEASKTSSFVRFLFGLGIRQVGFETAQTIVDYLKERVAAQNHQIKMKSALAALRDLGEAEFQNLPDVGEVVAKNLFSYFQDKNEQAVINQMISLGLRCSITVTTQAPSGPLQHKTLVLTGTLSRHTREAAADLIRQAGGKVSNIVSLETAYVLAGEKAGRKLRQAEKLEIPILTEDEFEKMLKLNLLTVEKIN